jgi:hypothetical protein
MAIISLAGSPVIETKEADPSESEEKTTDPTVEKLQYGSYPYQTRIERKSKP